MAYLTHVCQLCPCLCFELAPILALSPEGEIQQASQPLAEQLGYRPDELAGKPLAALVMSTDAQTQVRCFLKALQTAPCARLDTLLQAASGRALAASLFGCRQSDKLLVWVKLEINLERQQRNLLLREIHHRIKNNLQGIAGLLSNQALAHPNLAPLLAAPISQIHTIAQLHGLYAQGEETVFLCQLCQIITQAGKNLCQVPLMVDIPYVKTIQVKDQEAVPLALVLNELLVNAIKHGSGPVQLRLRCLGQSAQVILTNPSASKLAVDLATGQGLGTGLQLVCQLLPKDLAHLSLRQEDGEVIASLTLHPPLVRILA